MSLCEDADLREVVFCTLHRRMKHVQEHALDVGISRAAGQKFPGPQAFGIRVPGLLLRG